MVKPVTTRPLTPSDARPALFRRLKLAPSQRFLLGAGLLLIASGIVHGIVFLATGGSWEGPVSWRKPILFGFSFGITAITVALIASALKLRTGAGWAILGSLGVASVLETALITMQTWRGVPSHFNFSSTFDALVFIAMGVLVTIVAVALLALTVPTFTSLRPAPPSLGWAIRVGMVLLIAAQVLGVLIVTTGVESTIIGEDTAVFGPAGVILGAEGVLKSPHGIAMHAIQVLPVLALLAFLTRWTERRRILAVGAASIGYTLIVVVSTVQAYTGQAVLALSWATLMTAVLGVLLVAVPAVAVVASIDRRRIRPRAGQQSGDKGDGKAQPGARRPTGAQ